MSQVKNASIRVVELINMFGFSLIVGAVIYFIIGEIASLVGGEMLDWTFCGAAHRLIDVDWCSIEPHTAEGGINRFVHHLFNVAIPWFMIFWGFILTGFSALALKLLGYRYTPPQAKRLEP